MQMINIGKLLSFTHRYIDVRSAPLVAPPCAAKLETLR